MPRWQQGLVPTELEGRVHPAPSWFLGFWFLELRWPHHSAFARSSPGSLTGTVSLTAPHLKILTSAKAFQVRRGGLQGDVEHFHGGTVASSGASAFPERDRWCGRAEGAAQDHRVPSSMRDQPGPILR